MNIPGINSDVYVGRPGGEPDWRAMMGDDAEGEDYSEDGTPEDRAAYKAMGIDLDAMYPKVQDDDEEEPAPKP